MSFVTKWCLTYSFVSTRPAETLTVSRISTYTVRITKPDIICRIKTEWQRWKPMPEIVMLLFSNHACGLCLSPYIAFLTLFSPWVTYPRCCSIYITPFANHHIRRHSWHLVGAKVTTNWRQENKILIEFNRSNGVQPSNWRKTLKVIHTIGLSITFGNRSGLISIHRTIWVILQSVDPSTTHNNIIYRCRDQLSSSSRNKRFHILIHDLLPGKYQYSLFIWLGYRYKKTW